MFKIDIHTHILPENLNEVTNSFSDPRFLHMELIDDQSAMLKKDGGAFRKVNCNCWNHQKRIQECDTARVDVQVLSTIPVLFSYWAKDDEGLMLSRFLNDHIAKVVRNTPKRFIGLGTVPMQNIDLAIEEMDRCITKLNLPGIEIGSNVNGRNLSEAEFQPIFEHAEKIGCAIFVHPWEMMGQADMQKYWLPWLVGCLLKYPGRSVQLYLAEYLKNFLHSKLPLPTGVALSHLRLAALTTASMSALTSVPLTMKNCPHPIRNISMWIH